MNEIWIKPNRNDLQIKDLVIHENKDQRLGRTITHLHIVHHQETNQFCRYPELYPFFQEHYLNGLEWNALYNTIRVKLDHRSKLDLHKDVLPMLLQCFRDNKNIAINASYSSLDLTSSSRYIYQDFEDYRVDCIANIHKQLGLSLHGYGNYLYEYKFKDGTLARHITNPPRFENMTKEQLKLFYDILETKNSWGKKEIKTLVLEISAGIRTEV